MTVFSIQLPDHGTMQWTERFVGRRAVFRCQHEDCPYVVALSPSYIAYPTVVVIHVAAEPARHRAYLCPAVVRAAYEEEIWQQLPGSDGLPSGSAQLEMWEQAGGEPPVVMEGLAGE